MKRVSDNVRIVTRYNPHTSQDEEVVQEWRGGQWQDKAAFGHMSDDYALTNAHQYARSLSSPLAQPE